MTTPDVLATNGVIHVINRVLIPRGFSLETENMTFDTQSLEAILNSTDVREERPPTRSEMQSQLQYQDPANWRSALGIHGP